MSKDTSIQWTDSAVNPVMGCCGCELWPTLGQITRCIADFLVQHCLVALATARTQAERVLASYEYPSDVYHARHAVAEALVQNTKLSRVLVKEVAKLFRCYAGCSHLIRCVDNTRPHKRANKGYAPKFELPTLFPHRMKEAAKWSELRGKARADKPWLDGLPRLIFVSDMADALSPQVPFTYLREEVITHVASPQGARHVWLWLTKLPGRMAEFARWLLEQGISWPENLVAMTSITSSASLGRVEHLRLVSARLRGLSVEPLIETVKLELTDIDWVIVGGESGVGARPFDVSWALSLRDACETRGVAFFLKQLGAKPERSGRAIELLDSHGGDWKEWEQDLRVREIPSAFRNGWNGEV